MSQGGKRSLTMPNKNRLSSRRGYVEAKRPDPVLAPGKVKVFTEDERRDLERKLRTAAANQKGE